MKLFICFLLLLSPGAIVVGSGATHDSDSTFRSNGFSYYESEVSEDRHSDDGLASVRQNPQPPAAGNSPSDLRKAAERRKAEIMQILSDPVIWGPDLGAALETLPQWVQNKEDKVVIYKDTLTSLTNYSTKEFRKASALASRLQNALKTKSAFKFRTPQFEALLNKASVRAWNLLPTGQVSESGRLHVLLRVNSSKPLRLLADDLTVEELKARFAFQPEVKTQIVKLPGAGRPDVLTHYVYAGGDIVFVESEIDSPGYVTKVLFDARELQPVLFKKK